MKFLVLQHAPHEGPGRYGRLAGEAGIELKTVELWEPDYRMPLREEYREYDGAFVMGGPQGVNDLLRKYLSRDDEIKFLQEFNRPALCVCLGSHLLAYSQGGNVRRGGRKECGFYAVRLTPQGKNGIFRDLGDQIDVFHWHGDVFAMPEGAVPLAMSKYDQSVQAFSIDGKIGMLFHLEMSLLMIGDLFEADRDWFGSRQGFREYHGNTEEEVKRRAEELDEQMERNAWEVFYNFVSIVSASNL